VKLFLIIAIVAILALVALAMARSGPRVTTITRRRDEKDDDHA
jgi:Tfp pilus assembly protein FimT